MLYLLDTNILSELIRNPSGTVAARVSAADANTICTSIIVACEMWFGAAKRNSLSLHTKLADLFEQIPVVPLSNPAQHHYASLRSDLEKRGMPISANDTLIAAHALSLDAILVTDNEREFSRVSGLKLENWLRT